MCFWAHTPIVDEHDLEAPVGLPAYRLERLVEQLRTIAVGGNQCCC